MELHLNNITSIPFFTPSLEADEKQALIATFDTGWLTTGEESRLFEAEFSEFVGADYAISTSSCSAALILALESLKLPHGSEVLVPSLTFVSTVNAILHCGLVPIFVDVDLHDHNISVPKLHDKITKNTRALICVHFAGEPCELESLRMFCDDHTLFLIEDAAHALPAHYKGSKIGSCLYSDMTCFSFYANKTLTTGEGGMVTTNNKQVAEYIQLARSHFMDKHAWNRFSTASNTWQYDVSGLGHKFNLPDLNAAIGRVQLMKQDNLCQKRSWAVNSYRNLLGDIEHIELTTPAQTNFSANHLFQIKVSDRNGLFSYLKKNGVSCSVHYTPVHLLSYYRGQGFNTHNLDNTEIIGNRALSLPLFPSMTHEQISIVCHYIKNFYNE
jgi:dTDP-4-amino-4,6-dideoxygalactose transaminase